MCTRAMNMHACKYICVGVGACMTSSYPLSQIYLVPLWSWLTVDEGIGGGVAVAVVGVVAGAVVGGLVCWGQTFSVFK